MPSSMQLFYRGPGCATKTFGHIILIALLLSTFTISSVLAGTLLVSRLYDNVISQVDSHTGEILNANFITGLKTPFGVVFDAQGHLFVANFDGGTVGKYDANTGAVINAEFLNGLSHPFALALDSKGYLYVISGIFNQVIGKYNAITGEAINPQFIVGQEPISLAFNKSDVLYVYSDAKDTISLYDSATGELINPAFITGFEGSDLAEMIMGPGDTLLIADTWANRIRAYNAETGALINRDFITGLNWPVGLQLDGDGNLYVANSKQGQGSIGKYNSHSGDVVNKNLSVISNPISLAFVPQPLVNPPTGLVAVAGNASAMVNWMAPNGGSIPARYTVTSKPDSRTCSSVAPTTNCVVGELTNGTSYTFTAQAFDAQGNASQISVPSNPVIPASEEVPGACGAALNVASLLAPTTGLCLVGTASIVSSDAGYHAWICSGIGGGANAQCTAPGRGRPGSNVTFESLGCAEQNVQIEQVGGDLLPTGVTLPSKYRTKSLTV